MSSKYLLLLAFSQNKLLKEKPALHQNTSTSSLPRYTAVHCLNPALHTFDQLLTLLVSTYMVIVCHAGRGADLLIVLVIYDGRQPR